MRYPLVAVTAAVLASATMLSACGSNAPKPLEAKNVSAPLKPPPGVLPPGLATPLHEGEAVAIKVPLPLLTAPSPAATVDSKLPAGSLVTLKTRILNGIGPWWLVETKVAAGWIPEHELLRK